MFEIEVKNLKSTDIDIVIQDQMPVTQNKDISIEILETSKAEFNKSTGDLEWKLKLKSRESAKLTFGYKVKYDKNQNVQLK